MIDPYGNYLSYTYGHGSDREFSYGSIGIYRMTVPDKVASITASDGKAGQVGSDQMRIVSPSPQMRIVSPSPPAPVPTTAIFNSLARRKHRCYQGSKALAHIAVALILAPVI